MNENNDEAPDELEELDEDELDELSNIVASNILFVIDTLSVTNKLMYNIINSNDIMIVADGCIPLIYL